MNQSMEYYLTHGYSDEQTQQGIENFYNEFGFYLEQSLEGDYRLMHTDYLGNEHYVAEDPACEDTYDKDFATCEFYEVALNYASRHRLYVTTLPELADYINSCDEWPADVEDIIDRLDAVNDCGEKHGVCHDDNQKVVINNEGMAEVVDL